MNVNNFPKYLNFERFYLICLKKKISNIYLSSIGVYIRLAFNNIFIVNKCYMFVNVVIIFIKMYQ